ncbi:hypothetical protein [Roseococcus sp. YIM B11640]|uniref:hypothetical protein n=1 Tax=Roseococcus sp. YIM B11640 TaxID=3133973 RepID=UPI003C7D50E9
MDQLLRLTIRLSQWLRRRPSRQQLIIMLVVLGVGLLLVAIERGIGWPSALTTNNAPRPRVPHLPR